MLPEAAISEETNGNAVGHQTRRSFGNIDLLEERRERDLVTGELKGNGSNEPRGVEAIEKELASELQNTATSGQPNRPRSGTGDARVQAAQQKAAGECDWNKGNRMGVPSSRPSHSQELLSGN